MKFVAASYGTRGDVEPGAAVGRELQRRGHDVVVAVAPNLVSLVESAGLAAAAYGPDTSTYLDAERRFWTCFFGDFWRIPDLIKLAQRVSELAIQRSGDMNTALTRLADGADLLLATIPSEQPASHVAEHYDIPLATLHYYPVRPNGQLIPSLPAPFNRSVMTASRWLSWWMNKELEATHRRELGLPPATAPVHRRFTEHRALEIQAFDVFCFPGLAAEWRPWADQRPFVGALTLDLTTDADEDVMAWTSAGTPPICFTFGSIPTASPGDTIAMITAACSQLGERALICTGGTNVTAVSRVDDVRVVGAVNYAKVLPNCRAVVHHGGSGTTAAGLRAGIPTLVLWTAHDQPYWASRVRRLNVGTSRRLSRSTRETLVADLRGILDPPCAARARDVATRMTTPNESASAAADLVEEYARSRRVGPSA